MRILYGIRGDNIDVTEFAIRNLLKDNIIHIPRTDIYRSFYFGDPHPNVLKSIYIIKNKNTLEFNWSHDIYINTLTNDIYTELDVPEHIKAVINTRSKLDDIYNTLQIKYGSFLEEVPEQRLALKYLSGNEKVLELGGNIGRNSLIIAHILAAKNNNDFVTLECDDNIAKHLEENRDLNGFKFQIECSALSKRNLIQLGWKTFASDIIPNGYKKVPTITYEELCKKYKIDFDTLVIDCEGAFYYILTDMPEILNGVNLIIMENDYDVIGHKNYVDTVLKKNNFGLDYKEAGGWGCCYDNFYEVWKRN
jgi:FkbM family methyltransferase